MDRSDIILNRRRKLQERSEYLPSIHTEEELSHFGVCATISIPYETTQLFADFDARPLHLPIVRLWDEKRGWMEQAKELGG